MRSVRRSLLGVVAVSLAAAAGCAHAPEFRPWDEERAKKAAAADAGPLASTDAQILIFKDRGFPHQGIEDVLLASGARIATVSDEAEYTVSLESRAKGAPSPWNFLISWPGFMIFAPAWHGMIYKYDVDAVATIRDASGRTLPPVKVQREYDARYTEVWQGVLIESGWFIWYSIPAFAGGIVTATVPPELAELNAHLPDKERRAIGASLGRAVARALAADANNLAMMRATVAAKPRPDTASSLSSAPAAAAQQPPAEDPVARLQAHRGGLRIDSTPPGAAVFVNDLYVGEAPVEVWPRPGKHRVVVSMAGHESVYEEVEVGADGLKVQADLRALAPKPGASEERAPSPPDRANPR
jgi:hypothetical protein